MEEIVASVADLKFEIEAQMYNQVGVQPLPFPGMDSTIQTLLDCHSLSFALYFLLIETSCVRDQLLILHPVLLLISAWPLFLMRD